jgi:hypothetical protein
MSIEISLERDGAFMLLSNIRHVNGMSKLPAIFEVHQYFLSKLSLISILFSFCNILWSYDKV